MERVIVIAEDEERKLIEQVIPGCRDRVIVTGVGAFNIIQGLRDIPMDTEILNIGYAGSTNFEIGTVVEVSESKLNHPSVTYEEPTYKLHTTGEYPHAICYTNRDLNFYQFVSINNPVASTFMAFVFDDLPCSTTVGTYLLGLHSAKHGVYGMYRLSCSTTLWTFSVLPSSLPVQLVKVGAGNVCREMAAEMFTLEFLCQVQFVGSEFL